MYDVPLNRMKEHDITNELKKAYPIKGKVEGWYFRTTETSAGVFLIEGRSVRGASISKQCAEPELDEVFAGCQREAQQIEGETVPLTDDDEAGLPRFHSLTAVGLAAYLGGPLAAGILIRRNFISMGEPGRGSWALWLSLLATVAIFGGTALAIVFGLLLERLLFRHFYQRDHLDQVLLTFGLIYVFEELRSLV